MKTLRATEHFDSLYNRKKNGIMKEDHDVYSLDDVYASRQPSSSTSLFNDYCFSDDEEEKQSSFMMQASMYLDDISGDSEETRRKKERKQKKHLASRPSGGALEDLFSPTAAAKSPKSTTKNRSTPVLPLPSKSRSLPAISQLGSKKSQSGTRLSNHTPSANHQNYFWEVDEDEYETDTDDEGLELATNIKKADSKEAASLRRKSLIKKALIMASRVEDKIPRTPVKAKGRILDALSLSTHRKNKHEDDSAATLTLNKTRSSSLSGPRYRLPLAKNDVVEDSDAETDSDCDEDMEFGTDSKDAAPIRRKSSIKKQVEDKSSRMPLSSKGRIRDALSLSTHRKSRRDSDLQESPAMNKTRSSSLLGPRYRRPLAVEDSGVTLPCKPKRSTSLVSMRSGKASMDIRKPSKKKGLDRSCHSTSCDDDMSHRSASVKSKASKKKALSRSSTSFDDEDKSQRSSSVKPKLSKKKSFDRSIHSTTSNDDEKSPRSASASRKKKKRSSSVTRGQEGLESSSVHSATRSSTVKRKKKKDLLDCSNHSQVSSASAMTRRKPIKKSESTPVLAMNSLEQERRVSKSSKKLNQSDRMSIVIPKTRRVPIKKNAEGDVIQPESTESLSSSSDHGKRVSRSKSINKSSTKHRASINASLASSEHGGRRSARDQDDKKLSRQMKRRNSSIA